MVIEIGSTVRVKSPFDETFDGEYLVVEINTDGVFFLEGIEAGFAADYLEPVA